MKAELPTSRPQAYQKTTKWTLYPGTEGGKGGGTRICLYLYISIYIYIYICIYIYMCIKCACVCG